MVVNYSSSKGGADAVVDKIKKKGGKAIAVQGNVARQEDIAKLFQETVSALKKVDILINNAGIYEFKPLDAITPEHFHSHFDLNVLGLLLTTQEAVKHFPPDGGSIVNIGSIVGPMPAPMASVYSATKAAVDAITVSLSKELGPRKIRVNSVNPGMVDTEGYRSAGLAESEERKFVEAGTPLGRIAQPEDIGKAVAFFASDDAGWLTGQIVIAAGGFRM